MSEDAEVRRIFARDPGSILPTAQLPVVYASDHDRVVAALKAENEALHMKLAACGVAAGCNTTNSRALHLLPEDSPYWSASYQDVLNAVEREMALREQLAEAEKDAARWRKLLTMRKELIAEVVARPTLRYPPERPFTLTEVIDAALSTDMPATSGKPLKEGE